MAIMLEIQSLLKSLISILHKVVGDTFLTLSHIIKLHGQIKNQINFQNLNGPARLEINTWDVRNWRNIINHGLSCQRMVQVFIAVNAVAGIKRHTRYFSHG